MAYNENKIITQCLSENHSEYETHMDVIKHAENLAQRVTVKLKGYCKNGLPSVYKDFDEYLSDFWPDLPWTDALRISTDRILRDDLDTVREIKEKFGYDFEADLIRVREHGVW